MAVSLFPALFNLLGISFDSIKVAFEPNQLGILDVPKVTEKAFGILNGSFTHTLLEWTAVVVSMLTAVLAFVHYSVKKDAIVPVIGVAIFCAGCVDAFHTLATDRLISAVAENKVLIPFSWAIGRVFNLVVKVAGALFFLTLSKEIIKKIDLKHVLGICAVLASLSFAIVLYCAKSSSLPQVMFPDSLIARPYDFGVLVFAATIALYVFMKTFKTFPSYFSHALVISLIPDIVTQLHMSFGSSGLFDNHFNIAHFTKIISYLVPTIGICLDYVNTHKEEQRGKKIILDNTIKLEIAHKNLSELNLNLEKIVEERTAQLNDEVSKVTTLLNNMTHGVFSVSENGLISAPVSKYCDVIFKGSIIGKDIFDVLYKEVPRTGETYASLKTSLLSAYGGGSLQFDLICDNFIKSIHFEKDNQDLNAVYAPIWNKNGLLEKLLVIVEDVTEIKKLERTLQNAKDKTSQSIQYLEEIVPRDLDDVKNFVMEATDKLSLCFNLANSVLDNLENRKTFLRELHTIKGNARLNGLKLFSGTVHGVEGDLAEIFRKHNSLKDVKKDQTLNMLEPLSKALKKIQESLNIYKEVMKKYFKVEDASSNQTSDSVKINIQISNLNKLEKAILESKEKLKDSGLRGILDNFNSLFDVNLKSEFLKLGSLVNDLSDRFEKKVRFEVEGDNSSLSKESFSLLFDAVGHIVRNSIDHGIELPEDRRKMGKNEEGIVRIKFREDKDNIVFKIEDDGQGIDVDKLVNNAITNKIKTEQEIKRMSEQEKLALVFCPGLSTKDEANEISGRGVGGDVVKCNLDKIGGKVTIINKINKGTAFEFSVRKGFYLLDSKESMAA